MKVWIKFTLCFIIGVRNVVSYLRPLSCNVTNFCHDIYIVMIIDFLNWVCKYRKNSLNNKSTVSINLIITCQPTFWYWVKIPNPFSYICPYIQ
jgi:hypothetical protein